MAVVVVMGLARWGWCADEKIAVVNATRVFKEFKKTKDADVKMKEQADEFDAEREKMLADLHIEERLARYPQYVQDAIWAREVVPGMDTAAVLLSWGRPDAVDRLNADQSKGVDQQVWQYRRGPQGKDDYRVLMVQGVVTSVEKP